MFVVRTVTVISDEIESRHVVIQESETSADKEVSKIVEKALKSGSTVRLADGTRIWEHIVESFDPTKEGSSRYVWHADGNRVRCQRIRYYQGTNGEVTTELRGSLWKHV